MRHLVGALLLLFLLLCLLASAGADEVNVDVHESYLLRSSSLDFGMLDGGVADTYGRLRERGEWLRTEGVFEGEYHSFIGHFTIDYDRAIGGTMFTRSANTVPAMSDSRSRLEGESITLWPELGYRWRLGSVRLDILVGVRSSWDHMTGMGGQGSTLGTLTRERSLTFDSSQIATERDIWRLMPTIGLRASYPLTDRLTLSGSGHYIPWSYTESSVTWPGRVDTQHPSLYGSTTGGHGYVLSAGLSYRVWRGLSVIAGVSYERFDSGSGGDFTFRSNRSAPTAHFRMRDKAESWGPWIGVKYEW